MIAAAEMAELAYIVNVVIDDDKNTVAAFAGDPVLAHEAGVNWLKDQCAVKAVPADIVITSNGGAPMDQNLYQCVKGLTAAEATAKPGAVLIICAEAADGVGGEGFYRSLLECEDAAKLYEAYCATPQDKTIPDQWQTQILARILMKHRVIFVSRKELAETIREMKMDYAETLEEALAMARETVGEGGTVTAIPNGISVIVLAE
jgi:nickel-dependent lactate racemase